MKKILPEIITIGSIIIGALCYPLVSSGLQLVPQFLLSDLRVLIAGISILLVLPLFHQPILPPKSIRKWVIIFSIPAVVFTYGTMFLSHGKAGITLVPVLENLQPILTTILATVFLHEKLSPATRFVLVFGTMGIFFLSVQFNPSFLVILIFLAIVGTGATSAVWYTLIQKVNVSRLSVLFFLSPAFGLLMANKLFAMPITLLEWLGIITILIGVIVGIRKQAALSAPLTQKVFK